jgi:hypothetical protein
LPAGSLCCRVLVPSAPIRLKASACVTPATLDEAA